MTPGESWGFFVFIYYKLNLNFIIMGIKREEIKGTVILNEIESGTIVRSQYDTENKDMIVEFKNGTRYQYNEVPHATYTKFRMAESQGKYFSNEIAKKFKYTKL